MPIYEYRCTNCGEKFEAFCGLVDVESELKCPKCGSKNPEKDRSKYFGKTPTGESNDFTFPT